MADEKARCIILGSLSNVLHQQHMGIATTYEIFLNLQEMFGDKDGPIRQAAVRTIMSTKMTKGTPVRDHMICMISLFNEMEILRDKIDGETQVAMILETLPDSFKKFKPNYNMNKLMMSLTELMKELQMVEEIIKELMSVHMAIKESSCSSRNKKKKNSFKNSKQGKNKTGKGKSKCKGKCFIYGKKGRWKKECLDFLKKKEGISHSILVESCLVVDSTNSWWIDSGATDHIYNSL